MKLIHFIHFICLFKKVFLLEILNKNCSISTNSKSIIFNSTDFSINENIFFKMQLINKSKENSCDKILKYDFYDNINDINNNNKNLVYLELGDELDLIYFFHIKKDIDILGGANGKYLLIHYNCTDYVIIENYINKSYNTEQSSNSQNTGDIVFEIVVSIVIVGFCILLGICCCYDKLKCVKQKEDINSKIGSSNLEKNESSKNENNSVIYIKYDKNSDKFSSSNRGESFNKNKNHIEIINNNKII